LRSRDDVLAFERFTSTEKYHIALNLAHEPRRIVGAVEGHTILSTHLDRKDLAVKRSLLLRPDEGVIIRCRE
jgi:alpha-glucosidase